MHHAERDGYYAHLAPQDGFHWVGRVLTRLLSLTLRMDGLDPSYLSVRNGRVKSPSYWNAKIGRVKPRPTGMYRMDGLKTRPTGNLRNRRVKTRPTGNARNRRFKNPSYQDGKN